MIKRNVGESYLQLRKPVGGNIEQTERELPAKSEHFFTQSAPSVATSRNAIKLKMNFLSYLTPLGDLDANQTVSNLRKMMV